MKMKKILRIKAGPSRVLGPLVFLAVCLSLSGPGRAVDLLPQGLPSAAKAMGGSGLAGRNGLADWLLNPALNIESACPGVTSVYSGLNGDASVFGLGVIYPLSWANLSAAYIEADSGSFLHTRETGGEIEVLDEFSYTDRWLVLGASRRFNSVFTVGGQLKYVQEGFSGPYGAGQGLVTDLGLLGQINEQFQVGLVAQNFLLRRISWSGEGSEVLPTHYKAGLSWQPWPNLALEIDGDYCSYYSLIFKGGADWTVNEFLELRAGLAQQPHSPGRSEIGYTLGLGLNFDNVSLDYAYCPGPILDETTAHYFSLSYRFADAAPAAEPVGQTPPAEPFAVPASVDPDDAPIEPGRAPLILPEIQSENIIEN